jgi:hypothetical protein
VIEHIGWYIEWAAEWLRVAKERPGLVVLSYHDELSNLRVLLARVFDELSIEPPPTIESGFAARGPLREKSPGNWRQDLTRQTQDHLESRIRAKLAPFSACDRLWS